MRGEENYPANIFFKSFVSLIFENAQGVSRHAQVLSIVIDGVDQAVTVGSLQHSRGEKNEYFTLNIINESISSDLAFSHCLTWLRCLVEIIGNSFFIDLIIGSSKDQTPRHPLIACRMGVQCQILQSICNCRNNGGVIV